jgi:hypothetical protein
VSALGDFFQPSHVFEMGWENARRSPDLYWSPTTTDWPRFAASDVTRIPHGDGYDEPDPVKVDGVVFVSNLYLDVERTWQTAKKKHPAAVWSPRDGMWYDHKWSGGGAGKPPLSQPAKALVQRLDEIKVLRGLDENERLQQRNRALRDYADQLAAPPP